MAKRQARRGKGKTVSGGPGPAVAGIAVVAVALGGGAWLYLHTGTSSQLPPTQPTVAEHSSASERSPAGESPAAALPGKGRQPEPPAIGTAAAPVVAPPATGAGLPPKPPFGTSEEVFEGGARVYAANCAGCHGRPGKNAKGPAAAQFWDAHNAAGARAVAEAPGTIYQAIAKGNLLQGMPSYGQRLPDTQIWDMALLIGSAHEDLPEPVLRLLRGGR